MRKIPLGGKFGQGIFALVDDDLFPYLSQWSWFAKKAYKRIYAVRSFHGITLYLHYCIIPCRSFCVLDHINGDTIDNRRENLREATRHDNASNSAMRFFNRSGYKGVHPYGKKWIAQIQNNRKKIHIGVFATKEQAAMAYNEAAKKLHGAFARINIITH
jgi:hypothetical protein